MQYNICEILFLQKTIYWFTTDESNYLPKALCYLLGIQSTVIEKYILKKHLQDINVLQMIFVQYSHMKLLVKYLNL